MTPREVIMRALSDPRHRFDPVLHGYMPQCMVVERALKQAGYAIVPIKPNEEMLEELARIGDGPAISGGEVWGYMLAAAKAHPEPESR